MFERVSVHGPSIHTRALRDPTAQTAVAREAAPRSSVAQHCRAVSVLWRVHRRGRSGVLGSPPRAPPVWLLARAASASGRPRLRPLPNPAMPNTTTDAPASSVVKPHPPEMENKSADADACGAPAVPAASPPKEVPVPAAYLESTSHHLPSLDEYNALYARSVADPAAFWSDIAREFHWHKPWPADTPPIAWNYDPRAGPVFTHFWKGGQTNICYNALDVHVAAGGGDTVAFFFEPNDPDDGRARPVTYAALLADVCRTAHALRAAGVGRGDAVVTYMPMGVELPTVMLAAARIGAVHSVVFGGFSPVALAGRLAAANAAVMVTCDGVRRGSKWIDLKAVADEAVAIAAREHNHTVRSQIVVASGSRPAGGEDVLMTPGRDVWWDDALQGHPSTCDVVWVDAEDPLFCLFTSGSTGAPKGIVHTVGGYMVGAATTFKYSFNYMPGDVFFCTADCGWITVRVLGSCRWLGWWVERGGGWGAGTMLATHVVHPSLSGSEIHRRVPHGVGGRRRASAWLCGRLAYVPFVLLAVSLDWSVYSLVPTPSHCIFFTSCRAILMSHTDLFSTGPPRWFLKGSLPTPTPAGCGVLWPSTASLPCIRRRRRCGRSSVQATSL